MIYTAKEYLVKAGARAQGIRRALTALAEHPLGFQHHMASHTVYNSSSKGWDALSGLCRNTHGTQIYMQQNIHIHNINF